MTAFYLKAMNEVEHLKSDERGMELIQVIILILIVVVLAGALWMWLGDWIGELLSQIGDLEINDPGW